MKYDHLVLFENIKKNLENLEKMNKFLDIHDLLKLNQEDTLKSHRRQYKWSNNEKSTHKEKAWDQRDLQKI